MEIVIDSCSAIDILKKDNREVNAWLLANGARVLYPWIVCLEVRRGVALKKCPPGTMVSRPWVPRNWSKYVNGAFWLIDQGITLKPCDLLVLSAAKYLGCELASSDGGLLSAAESIGIKVHNPRRQ